MRLNEVYETIERLASKRISDEYCQTYDAYDNSGILIDSGDEITGVLFSLDFSFAAIKKAREVGANLIVTHHPAIYGKISDICVSKFLPLGEKLAICLKNGISVISMHLNLDCASGGIDESLMHGLAKCANGQASDVSIMHTLSQGGYGRAYGVQETELGTFIENIKKEFQSERVLVYANGKKSVKKAASFCGSGADEWAVEFAVQQGADVMISSDFKHHVLTLANEKGIAVIALTHYASENYGFNQFYKKICRQFDLPCVYHTDEELL